MGVAETAVQWAGFGQYKDAIAFVVLIVVLLFRPGGLLGSSKVEKIVVLGRTRDLYRAGGARMLRPRWFCQIGKQS